MISKFAAAAAVLATVASGTQSCDVQAPTPSAPEESGSVASDGAVVVGSSFSRNSVREIHHAECETPAGERFMVEVTAEAERQLRDGQPCPAGVREPMASDKYPEIAEELQEPLPYGGGDKWTCGEWETVDKEEARQLAAECPPLKWGDLG